MKTKNKKYDEKKYFMDIERLSEKYIMLSTCFSRHNIEMILFHSISRLNDIFTESNNNLNNWLKNINTYTIFNVEEYRQLLTDYNSTFFNYPTAYIDDFISFCSSDLIHRIIELSYIASGTGRKSVPLNNANVNNRNLIYTFNSKVFLEHVKDETEIPFYANAFWNFIMLILLTEYVNSFSSDNEVISLDLFAFHNFIRLNILTGLRMSAELKTDVFYEELFEEISQFVPSNKHNIVKTVNEEKQNISFRVKNNYLLTTTFKRYGWKKVIREFDPILDRKSEGELRIKHGSKPNSIRFTLYITGMRTISRILSNNCNPKGRIFLHNFWEKGGIYVSFIISFYFITIIENCSRNIYKSYYTTYRKFIRDYKGERNTALKSLVVVMLSKLPSKKRISVLTKNLKKDNYRLKKDILDNLRKLDNLLKKDSTFASKRLYNTLRQYYVW